MVGITSRRIIVAALNWGLGHATRCIPIIKALNQNNEVAIASDGNALELLKMTFPQLKTYELPAYDIHYRYQSMVMNMMLQAPKFVKIYNEERKATQEIIQDFDADMVISDNRFGVFGQETKNIFITHQLHIPSGNIFIGKMADVMHHYFINKYDECWIPDDEDQPLAGKMSQAKVKIPKKYIGILSRLEKEELDEDIDVLMVLSGPEPQRTKLENLLLENIDTQNKKVVLVRGVKGSLIHKGVEIHPLLGGDKLNKLINRAKIIICRSGYSSLMDLQKLGKKAILIPTPGQYEQEYLADSLDGKYGYQTLGQSEINSENLKALLR